MVCRRDNYRARLIEVVSGRRRRRSGAIGLIPQSRPSQCHWIYSIIRVRSRLAAGGRLRSARHVSPALTDDHGWTRPGPENAANLMARNACRTDGRRVTDIVRRSPREGRRACWQSAMRSNPRGAEITNSRRPTLILYLPRIT